MSEFRIKLLASWERGSSTYTKLAEDDVDNDTDLGDEDMDM
jgi:hypothetical protein